MKRIVCVFVLALVIWMCSCGDITFSNTIYRSVDPDDGLNQSFCEIELSDCKSSDTGYSASISGTMFVIADGVYRTITLANKDVVFTQECGTIWKAEVLSDDEQTTATLYMCRKGEEPIIGTEQEKDYNGYHVTAMEYESYGDALYLFYGKYEYLIYKRG